MGQHDGTDSSKRNSISAYYTCSPSVPPFIPQSPMTMAPTHYPYLYNPTYPQPSYLGTIDTPKVYKADFLSPPPMSHYVLTVDGNKVPVDTKPATKEATKDPQAKKYPLWTVFLTLTFWISVAQVALFVYSVLRGGFAPLSQNMNIGPPTSTLVDLGAKVAFLMKYSGDGWRFISAIFLHAGILHILLNLIAQVRLGISLERQWGRIKFLIVYLGAGVAGNLMSCLIQPDTVSVGASGAILGLVGGYFAHIILIWKKLERKEKKIQVIQAVFILLVLGLLSLAPHIDTSAHMGGLVIGFLLGFALIPDSTFPPLARYLRVIPAVLVAAFFAIGFWYFYAVQKPPTLTW